MPVRTYALANQKGGVGKTTTSINLAACLAEAGHRTLLIDFDPQGNATSGLGLEKTPGGSVFSCLIGEDPLEPKVISTGYENLDIIPSEVDLCAAEMELMKMENYLTRFQNVIAPMKQGSDYDFILIDCPPSLGVLTMNALGASDKLLIPMQCEYYALEGLSMILRVIDQLREAGVQPDLDVEGVIMTMYDGRTNHAQQVVQEVKNHFGEKVFKSFIPRTVRLSEAPSFGKPITDYDRNSIAATAYRSLARELVARTTAHSQ